MPTATGSVAFLGAARFQGYWDASQNLGTETALDGAFSGTLPALFQLVAQLEVAILTVEVA